MRSGQLALRDGVVPGGGAALNGCAEKLLPVTPAERILKRSMASPLRHIARLAGFDPDIVSAQARCHPGQAFDVIRQTWSATRVDPYPVVSAALDASVSAAATAISADAIVRRST
jgi:chaperonin GroEL (HSP60 family)